MQPSDQPDLDTTAPASGTRTGAVSLGEAVAALDALKDRPLEEHIGGYEALHERLQAELGSIESS